MPVTARKSSGFTLIELMIVVAIIGVLAAIALPNYNDYIMRSRITEAVAALADQRVKMEQFFQDNRTYAGACTNGLAGAPNTVAKLPLNENTKFFNFTCSNLTSTTYTVTATGKGAMTGFAYTLDEQNLRTTTVSGVNGWSGNASCWVLNKNGGC